MQVDALHLAGCEVTFEDVGSGADNSRKGLTDVLTRCAAGDALAASELDRLGPLDARSGRAGGEAEGQRVGA
jgi:DNA invertase Pin-like site-specific DNA recombinase